MDYQKIYDSIISRARRRLIESGYKEEHHVTPRCIGGSDKKNNLVYLTLREHFLAHWVLTKLYTGDAKRKLAYAFHFFTAKKQYLNSHLYEYARRAAIDAQMNDPEKDKKLSATVKNMRWVNLNGVNFRVNKGEVSAYIFNGYKCGRVNFVRKPHTKETLEKISVGNTGKKRSAECNAKMLLVVSNRVWVKKGTEDRFVKDTEVPYFISQGYQRGRYDVSGNKNRKKKQYFCNICGTSIDRKTGKYGKGRCYPCFNKVRTGV